MSSSVRFATSSTLSTIRPICTAAALARRTWTTTMQVRSAKSAFRPNFTRKSTIGITRPRRLITPFTKAGICGTGVIFCMRMISRTFRTAMP